MDYLPKQSKVIEPLLCRICGICFWRAYGQTCQFSTAFWKVAVLPASVTVTLLRTIPTPERFLVVAPFDQRYVALEEAPVVVISIPPFVVPGHGCVIFARGNIQKLHEAPFTDPFSFVAVNAPVVLLNTTLVGSSVILMAAEPGHAPYV